VFAAAATTAAFQRPPSVVRMKSRSAADPLVAGDERR
jgi:hypothetical protein